MPADGQSTALVRAPINAGGSVAAIVPQNFDDAWRIAGALAKAGMTPQGIDTQEKVLAVMMAGAEIGMPPFQALQSFAIINGRPALWGDGMIGVVRKHGCRVEETTDGFISDETFVATCKVTRPDTGEVVERSFSVAEAKRAGLWQTEARVTRKNFKTGDLYQKDNDSPWYRYPQRMIQMRARSWALRDGCADMLRGMKMAEEMQDVPEAEPVEARVIDRTGDYDQRPTDERIGKYGVIGGQAGRDVCDELAEAMSACEDVEALDAIEPQIDAAKVSANRTFLLNEHFERCRIALKAGEPCPDAPRFTEAPEPSPFAALKTQGEAVTDVASFNAWNAALKDQLGKCSPEERDALKALHAAKKSNPAGVAGKSEDAGETSAAPGGSASPASSSPFEKLKEDGLAILQVKGERRQRSAFTAWVAMTIDQRAVAAMSEAERAELEALSQTISKEIGA